jgi:hypothetical protein
LKVLDTLLNWMRQEPGGQAAASEAAMSSRDRRRAARHDLDLAVTLSRAGIAPVAALMVNISRSGAAIRIHGLHVPVPGPWPTRLRNGDEIWVSGLLDEPVSCWVVAVSDGVLRVHFQLDEPMRLQLREKLPILARS